MPAADERDRQRLIAWQKVHFAQLARIMRGTDGFRRTEAARAAFDAKRRGMQVEPAKRRRNVRHVRLQIGRGYGPTRSGVQAFVSVPRWAVEQLGLEPHQVLVVSIDKGKLVLDPARS